MNIKCRPMNQGWSGIKNEWFSLENGFGIKGFPSVNHVPRLVPNKCNHC
jgi:hypothetical protein